jgi:hypothetical protein
MVFNHSFVFSDIFPNTLLENILAIPPGACFILIPKKQKSPRFHGLFQDI